MPRLLLLRDFCSDQTPEGAGIGLAPCQQVIGSGYRLGPGILAIGSDHVLSGSNYVGVGDHDKEAPLSGPRYVQPESQWHCIIAEFTADAVIPAPEFKGVTIVQPTDSGPALLKCLGVICRYASDMLTGALIARHH